jgi:hypothetical protein
MHHCDKGWSDERTTRRGRVVEGQEPKEKQQTQSLPKSNGNRLQAHQLSH